MFKCYHSAILFLSLYPSLISSFCVHYLSAYRACIQIFGRLQKVCIFMIFHMYRYDFGEEILAIEVDNCSFLTTKEFSLCEYLLIISQILNSENYKYNEHYHKKPIFKIVLLVTFFLYWFLGTRTHFWCKV